MADGDDEKSIVPVVYVERDDRRDTLSVSKYNYDHRLLDMTAEHASAMKEVARCQFVVPAQEETARARESTKRLTLGIGILAFGIVCMMIQPAIAWQIVSALAIIEGGIAVSHVIDSKKKKLPPGSGE